MIICKSSIEIEKMRRAGLVVYEVLQELRSMVKPGLATIELEKVAEQRIKDRGARAAFKGLYNFP
jgi:methionyl aminopeptidase